MNEEFDFKKEFVEIIKATLEVHKKMQLFLVVNLILLALNTLLILFILLR